MVLRLVTWDDMDAIAEIWQKHYSKDFPFPLHSLRKQLEKYVIEDDGKIVLFGTTELNPEIIMMGNQDLKGKVRNLAYKDLLSRLESDLRHYKLDTVSCSVNNDNWERHVRDMGFDDPKHKILVKKIGAK